MGEKSKELVWHIYGKKYYKLLLKDINFSKKAKNSYKVFIFHRYILDISGHSLEGYANY